MKVVDKTEMIPNQLYYIERIDKYPAGFGSGRQIGLFECYKDDLVHFSTICDIIRPDGSEGYSGHSTSGNPGQRHTKSFRFYKPCIDMYMRRAILRRVINQVQEIGYNCDDFIE